MTSPLARGGLFPDFPVHVICLLSRFPDRAHWSTLEHLAGRDGGTKSIASGAPSSFTSARGILPAALSLGYSLLLSEALAFVSSVRFDPYVGFLHAPEYGRCSLALDLVEEFRAAIVDWLVLTLFNTDVLVPAYFTTSDSGGGSVTSETRTRFKERTATGEAGADLQPQASLSVSILSGAGRLEQLREGRDTPGAVSPSPIHDGGGWTTGRPLS